MAESPKAILIGVYGLVRGLLAVLMGLVLAVGASFMATVVQGMGLQGGGALAGMFSIIGTLLLVAGLGMWVASIGLFLGESWAPLLTVTTFGVVGLIGVLFLATGGVTIAGAVLTALDLVAAGWGALNAPQVPVGESKNKVQAI